jgi:hypothetical protein
MIVIFFNLSAVNTDSATAEKWIEKNITVLKVSREGRERES